MLLIAGDEAVAVDPGVTQDEIEAVRDRAASEGARVVAVIATHGDFDHVAGIASFPDAEAVMGPRAAARIASGAALRDMAEEGATLGLSWPGSPRCDRVLRVGRRERVGPFEIETMELEGHTDDGIGLRLRDPDVLIVGDYLSPIEYPFVYHSTVAYRSTLAGLADLLRSDPPAQIVPGHGAPLETPRPPARSPRATSPTCTRCAAPSPRRSHPAPSAKPLSRRESPCRHRARCPPTQASPGATPSVSTRSWSRADRTADAPGRDCSRCSSRDRDPRARSSSSPSSSTRRRRRDRQAARHEGHGRRGLGRLPRHRQGRRRARSRSMPTPSSAAPSPCAT